jgi:PIN domain nuclease of toxin-antitoxin system
MSPILLDTHVAIWSAQGLVPKKIGQLIDEAANSSELLLSPISAWEVGILVRKQRFSVATTLDDYVRTLFSRPGVVTAILTPAIAAASTLLPESVGKDPADRILVATAAAYGATLMTRDAQIVAFAKATRYVRCITC